ncbi:flagellar filament capping protein FliD [Undibacterium terreum]|uniref:Flagellar hook-associated protein 2 n=1 Tax=Undibacterium terreum TaxID=1224302 RepID=A0A916XCE1_9BURK|nr:flagellar filament capping protein FliD [Undibacterium terreum]GGC61500.1 flagellar hook-associated protein 2 [Undibacterium terreum]
MRVTTFTPGYTPPASSSGSNGSASVDIYNKVSQMMQSQNTIAPKLNAAIATDQATLSGLGKLSSLLSVFQGLANSVSGAGMLAAATSSDKTVLTASTSSTSAAGSYEINVKQLAQAQTLVSKSVSSATTALGAGNTKAASSTIKFEFGTTNGNQFTPGRDSAKTVSIPNGASLQDIATAINQANIGAKASVVQKGDGYALVLNSPSGAASSMRIGVDGDTALQGLIGFDPAGTKGLTQTAAAQDAQLTVDGNTVSSATNTVTGKDSLAGITLNLTATGRTTLTVQQNSSQIANNVTTLVNNYNALNSSLNNLKQGDLKSDGIAGNIKTQMNAIVSGVSGSLSAIGITVAANGDMQIDKTKLQNAIASDPDTVSKLFTNSGNGIADRWSKQITGLNGADGSIAKDKSKVNKDIAALTTQKDTVTKALTAQANALVDFYTKQSQQSGTGITGQDGQPHSLFDMLG